MEHLRETAGATPRSMRFRLPTGAWAEVRDAAGERLRTLTARLERGAIVVDLPAFPPGARGTVALLVDGGIVERTLTPGVSDLPTERIEWVVEFQNARLSTLPEPTTI